MDKLNINKTRVATALLLFPKEKGKVRTKPKDKKFLNQTNKMPEITGKGIGYTKGRC